MSPAGFHQCLQSHLNVILHRVGSSPQHLHYICLLYLNHSFMNSRCEGFTPGAALSFQLSCILSWQRPPPPPSPGSSVHFSCLPLRCFYIPIKGLAPISFDSRPNALLDLIIRRRAFYSTSDFSDPKALDWEGGVALNNHPLSGP